MFTTSGVPVMFLILNITHQFNTNGTPFGHLIMISLTQRNNKISQHIANGVPFTHLNKTSHSSLLQLMANGTPFEHFIKIFYDGNYKWCTIYAFE